MKKLLVIVLLCYFSIAYAASIKSDQYKQTVSFQSNRIHDTLGHQAPSTKSDINVKILLSFLIPLLFLIMLFAFLSIKFKKIIKWKNILLDKSMTNEREMQMAYERSDVILKTLYELMNEGVWEWSIESHELFFNLNIYRQLNYDFYEFPQDIEHFILLLHPEDKKPFVDFITQFIKSKQRNFEYQFRIKSKDNEYKWIQLKGSVSEYNEKGKKSKVIGFYSEITEKKRITDHEIQSQKMEAIGRLAGGISHDFNNLLTSILGNVDIAMVDVNKTSPLYQRLMTIKETSKKASELTKQLLFLSKKKDNHPNAIMINDTVKRMNAILSRIIGENILLSISLDENLPLIEMDSSQLDQIFLNLALRAKESMPNGGKLQIETHLIEIEDNCDHFSENIRNGKYIQICFSDTGKGMDEYTIKHLFEPFYQNENQVNGLGMAIVYNTITENSGFINVYSEKKSGTTIKIYLPVFEKNENKSPSDDNDSLKITSNQELVYVVEDNNEIRTLIEDILNIAKYQFKIFKNATDFLEFSKENGELCCDLMICDIILPEMKGYELIKMIKNKYRIDFKVMYISGYPDAFIEKEHGINSQNFLSKPFTASAFLNKINMIIEKDMIE